MRKFAALSLAIALVVLVSHGPAAAALGDKPIRWEYAELKYTNVVRFPVAGQQPAIKGVGVQQLTVRWCTAEEEIEGNEWEDLASKLKAPPPKKEGSPTLHKLRVLNRVGADGWEIIEHTGTDGTTGTAHWTFKRRAP